MLLLLPPPNPPPLRYVMRMVDFLELDYMLSFQVSAGIPYPSRCMPMMHPHGVHAQ